MAVPAPNIIHIPAASGNFGVGRGWPIDQVTFHHIVGDAQAAINRFITAGQQASSNYVIGSDGTIYQMVAESNTPYSDGTFRSNSRTISTEHAGGHANVPYTEAMYASSIHLHAWIFDRRGNLTVKRHRDIVATACPGALNVERIVSDALAMKERYSSSNTQGGTMLANQDVLNRLYLAILGRSRAPGEGEDVYLNKDAGWVALDLSQSAEKAARQREAEALKVQRDQLAAELSAVNNSLQSFKEMSAKELKDAKATVAALNKDLATKDKELKKLADQVKACQEAPTVPTTPPPTPENLFKQLLESLTNWFKGGK